nr:hypothetical protein [Morchella crassipes]
MEPGGHPEASLGVIPPPEGPTREMHTPPFSLSTNSVPLPTRAPPLRWGGGGYERVANPRAPPLIIDERVLLGTPHSHQLRSSWGGCFAPSAAKQLGGCFAGGGSPW